MNNKNTHFIRELSKFFSGLVVADILVGIWVGSGQGYGSIFLGMPLTQPLINIWIVIDVALLLLLLHYAWHIDLPPSRIHKVFYTTVGVLLAIVALLHFLRVAFSVPLIIGGISMPQWLSVIGAIITGFLAYASFHFANRK
ncbi:MAG: hypothetical protein KGI58_00620 [Patescibacteria group bacterium]|nr:hypothetical protein [Patescibacteria group bacterium]